MQILRSNSTELSPYPDLPDRKLDWESTHDACKIVSKIIRNNTPNFSYQTGPHSKKIADRFHRKKAYQGALEQYQKYFLSF